MRWTFEKLNSSFQIIKTNLLFPVKGCPTDEIHKSCAFREEYTCWTSADQQERVIELFRRLPHCRAGCYCKSVINIKGKSILFWIYIIYSIVRVFLWNYQIDFDRLKLTNFDVIFFLFSSSKVISKYLYAAQQGRL